MSTERCNDIEVQMEDGTWQRVGVAVIQASAVARPAQHDYEFMPPRYLRCKFCSATQETDLG